MANYLERRMNMMQKLTEGIKTIWRKGLLHILAGSFMTKLVSLFGSIFLVRVLSKQEYGVLGYLENIYGYVFVLAGMGMANAILRYVVLGKTAGEKYGYFRYAFKKAQIWNAVLIVVAGIVLWFFPHKEDYQNYVWMLSVLLLMLPLQNATELVLCNERAMFANQRYAQFSLLLAASVIVSKIAAGYFGGIQAVVFGQFAVYAIMAIWLYRSTKKTYFHGLQPNELKDAERSVVDRYAIQYMITNGLWTVFMLNDTFLLGRYCDPTTLADYRVAYTIPGCVNIISSAIGIFVAPYFVQNEKNHAWVRKSFKLAYICTAAVIGVVCLGIAVLAKPVVWLLYGSQYLNIVPVMRILLVAAFFNCGLRYTTANLLAAMGQVKYNMAISVLGMAMQLGVNIYMVPRYGAVGVAATSCGVYLFMAVVLLAIFLKKYYFTGKTDTE